VKIVSVQEVSFFFFFINHEVVLTGNAKMAHHLLALSVNPRNIEH